MPKLKEVNIDNNPGTRNLKLHYELILRIPKLRILNEDAVKELDRDIAVRFFEDEGLPLPEPGAQKQKVNSSAWASANPEEETKDSIMRTTDRAFSSFKKSVSFATDEVMTNEDQA